MFVLTSINRTAAAFAAFFLHNGLKKIMRKTSLFASALFLCLALSAQDAKFGLKGGINFATITNTDGDLKTGFHFGGLAHIHVTPAFSLQPEIMYSTQGVQYGSDVKTLLNYINIPVLLQYNFDNGFRLQGGPQLGIMVEAKNKAGNTEADVSDNYKSIDFSIPLGFSYLGYSGFGADARYNIGVTNVVENSTVNYRNSVIQLGVFYLFDHKHKARSK
jgi:hypothetical protein